MRLFWKLLCKNMDIFFPSFTIILILILINLLFYNFIIFYLTIPYQIIILITIYDYIKQKRIDMYHELELK
jgi:hypothetical protein